MVGQKLLRYGYTTGSCAAAAAKAAAIMLLSQKEVTKVELITPKGISLLLETLEAQVSSEYAVCAIKKDAGDDPDVTNGVLVYARVKFIQRGCEIVGGDGVGRVTKPGLNQPVGEAAINSVPRKMIAEALESVSCEWGYSGGFWVEISIPDGNKIAAKTFNPRIGIEGGISVLGTSGIVEPMSEKALVDTIRVELRMLAAAGEKDILITVGNYGETFAKNNLNLTLNKHLKCSNFIGDALAIACEEGFNRILLVGHVGKLVKLGIGMTNTHSQNGDGRIETLTSCALMANAEISLLRALQGCVTTDAALALLIESGILEGTMSELGRRIEECLARHVLFGVEIGYICFSNSEIYTGVLAKSANSEVLTSIWRKNK